MIARGEDPVSRSRGVAPLACVSRSRSTAAAVLFVSCFVPSRAHAESASDVAVADERPALVTVAPRIGLVAYGRGKLALECSGPCAAFAGSSTGYSHEPAFTFGADVLAGIFRYLRAGVSFEYTLENHAALAGSNASYEVGDDWVLDAVVEGFFPLAPRWGLVPRFEAGLIDVTPAGALGAHLDAVRTEFCDGAGPCSIERGARLGWNLAAGLGAWFRVHDRGRVRLDARVQYYVLDLYGLDATLLGSKIQVHETLSGARVLLTAGAEVF